MLGHSRLRAGFYVESVASRGARLGGAGRGGTRGDDEKRMPRTIGRWVVAGALDQADVEDAYAAAGHNGLLADDGQRQTWTTIRGGLGAGLAGTDRPAAADRPPAWAVGTG
jgi:hypothetical protein